MTDIVDRVWHAYHLATVQVDHPLRLLCEELRAVRALQAATAAQHAHVLTELDAHRAAGAETARTIADLVGEIQQLRERNSKLDDEAARMLRLARENGQLRDVAVRERDQAVRRAEAVERRWAAAADDRK